MVNSVILSYITFIYFFSFLLYLLMMVMDKHAIGKVATSVMLLGLAGHTLGLIYRWVESYALGIGHAPLSNLYESLIFFSWTIIFLYSIVEWRIKNRSIGTFVTPLAFLALAYASYSDKVKSGIQPLIPALQSNWLTAHVITCFFGYAAFALSFGLSYMYLLRGLNNLNPFSIKGRLNREKYQDLCFILFLSATLLLIFSLVFYSFMTHTFSGVSSFIIHLASIVIILIAFFICLIHIFQSVRRIHDLGKSGIELFIPIYNCYLQFVLLIRKGTNGPNNYGPPDQYYDETFTRLLKIIPKRNILDDLSYQMVVIGFLMLTLGIITGSVWAHSAWGSYWSWDPKETWSLITWLVYAALLHSRLIRGWKGKRLALFSIIGFVCVLFTWFGVNYLAGLHAYAV